MIPALEQVILSIDVTLINLYNEDLQAPMYTVWVARGMSREDSCERLKEKNQPIISGVKVTTLPTGCVVSNTTATPPNGDLDSSYVLDCTSSWTSIPAFKKDKRSFGLEINDVSITMKQVLTYNIYQKSRGA